MVKLTHIAEASIAEMFNRSPKVRGSFSEILDTDLGSSKAFFEEPLDTCRDLSFDGAHRIDVALIMNSNNNCIACEAKLGFDRLSQRAFEDRFLQGCGKSHGGKRIKGSMISILERKLPSGYECEEITVRRGSLLSSRWLLIPRRSVLDSWRRNGFPGLSAQCKRIAIEDIIDAFGGPTCFDELVREIVCRDYYQTWFGDGGTGR